MANPRVKTAYVLIEYYARHCATQQCRNGKHVYVPNKKVEALIQVQAHVLKRELPASLKLCLPYEPLRKRPGDSIETNGTKNQVSPHPEGTNLP